MVVERQNRRSTLIQVTRDGQVIVRVPRSFSDHAIASLIESKQHWIQSKLKAFSKLPPLRAKRRLVTGEEFLYLGQNVHLQFEISDQPSISLNNTHLHLRAQNPAIGKTILTEWYKSRATLVLQERTRHYASLMGISPKSVTVKSYKSRWGVCRSNGEVAFNWKLIQAPFFVLDYVVVHELCHLRELNHSQRFWKWVERFYPRYIEAKRWLRLAEQSRELEWD